MDIFDKLFAVAMASKDPRGAVSACLVRNGKVLYCESSSDDGVEHAEFRLFRKITDANVSIQPADVLYVTVEPCSKRTPRGKGERLGDCTTHIIKSGIKKVVYTASDEDASSETANRLKQAGIKYEAVKDENITQKARQIFNDSCANPNDRI